ncbi:MAG: ABC-F family ATP-binding cassette domain-containing protein [Planctomycetes bacterium]|nr:ABC-F family ATP-binding cassette domain-containing protein [Planctomycetota bacterium]
MPLVSLSAVAMHFGGPQVLEGVDLEVERGAKIGVIGQNGAGKSTLLRLMAGEMEPVAGRVVRERGAVIAYQAQEAAGDPARSVFDEMRAVFARDQRRAERLETLESALAGEGAGAAGAEAERDRLIAEYDRLHHEHLAAGGFDVDRRIAATLTALGLQKAAFSQPVGSFSGGERNVIGLARILLSNPDLMLLDEPSNHLDMDGVEWFIRFMRSCRAAVIMVSHNRHLLDATVSEIWEVRKSRVTRWTGDFSDFQRQKEEALAREERLWKHQQRLIRRIEFQARRLRDMARAYDDPGQARRAKAMLKRVEQMEKIEKPDRSERLFHATLSGAERHGLIALRVKNFTFAYGDRVIFNRADLSLEYGERVCLVGPNGSGKTTLLREVLSRGGWDNETLRLGKAVRAGEYTQFHEASLDLGATLLDWAQRVTALGHLDAARLLHRFLFTREDLDRPIATLSGGEKSRLQLARLAHQKVNFLILDEPTNHLDLQACEVLEEMLEEFDGTMLIVSHDRYFLDRLVNRVVEVRDRRLLSFRGTFAEWWSARREALAAAGAPARRGALDLSSRREAAEADGARAAAAAAREAGKERRRRLHGLRRALPALEEKIANLEARRGDLSSRLEAAWAAAVAPEARARAEALAGEFRAADLELSRLYAEWEQIAARIEQDETRAIS